MEIEFKVFKPVIETPSEVDVDENSDEEEITLLQKLPPGIEVFALEIETDVETETDEELMEEEETLILEEEIITEKMPDYATPLKTFDCGKKHHQYHEKPIKQVRSDLDLLISPTTRYVTVACYDFRPLIVDIG